MTIAGMLVNETYQAEKHKNIGCKYDMFVDLPILLSVWEEKYTIFRKDTFYTIITINYWIWNG